MGDLIVSGGRGRNKRKFTQYERHKGENHNLDFSIDSGIHRE